MLLNAETVDSATVRYVSVSFRVFRGYKPLTFSVYRRPAVDRAAALSGRPVRKYFYFSYILRLLQGFLNSLTDNKLETVLKSKQRRRFIAHLFILYGVIGCLPCKGLILLNVCLLFCLQFILPRIIIKISKLQKGVCLCRTKRKPSLWTTRQ